MYPVSPGRVSLMLDLVLQGHSSDMVACCPLRHVSSYTLAGLQSHRCSCSTGCICTLKLTLQDPTGDEKVGTFSSRAAAPQPGVAAWNLISTTSCYYWLIGVRDWEFSHTCPFSCITLSPLVDRKYEIENVLLVDGQGRLGF